MPLASPPPKIDFRLGYILRRIAGYLRSARFHRQGALLWSAVAVVATLLVLVQRHSLAFASFAAPALLVVFVLAASAAVWLLWRDRTTLRDAARYIGRQHPEADSALQAAVEQFPAPGSSFHFLQRRVIDDALRHADTANWYRRPRREAHRLLAAHIIAMVAALAISLLVIRAHRPAAPRSTTVSPIAGAFEITPGDAEIERHSAVVVAVRFPGDAVPSAVALAWQPSGSDAQRVSMHRSLSDPVFAFTLPSVVADTAYHIEHDGERSRSFTLTVYDRPALVRADATLDYPDYTGLDSRRIEDTRRISAVVGTHLDYEFAFNKPVARATLRTPDHVEVPLEPASPDRTRFRLATTLTTSARYSLHLVDDDTRTNAAPNDIRIDALENRRPELKLTFPSGDIRVSPLEELHLQAEARDDFGLRDYGVGISIADGEPSYVSLAQPSAHRTLHAQLSHLLSLEQQAAKSDQLITWFAWADDIGPDGQLRRTTSDIFFAEVRPLDEIFREDATGGGQPQQGQSGGGPGDDLIETQRQISIAIWKLRQQDNAAPSFTADAETLRDSQEAAARQLATVRERLEDLTARAAADEAAPLMRRAADALAETAAEKSPASLASAWTSARSAYQSLLRMQSRDTRVSQSRSGSGTGGRQRNRDQLNQLEFRNEEDRYETETEAQPPPTPEEREQLQVLARLRELSRRQEDLNRRLQELQTALAAAEDEAERDSIRRELKRLEEEQRRMISDLDDARQRVDRMQPVEQTQQAREQLDRTRDDMRRATEQLEQGEVSQALAAGTRAQENLQRTSEDMRQQAAGRFSEQMREARREARELATEQQQLTEELEEMSRGQQSLDDSGPRERLAENLENQAARRERLLENLRQVTEDAEASEPGLHRQLYDLLRQQNQSGAGRDLASSADMLRRGFVDPARDQQPSISRDLQQLQRGVERAAGAVLGDELNELRFAQRELEELARELRREQPTSAADQPSEPSSRNSSPDQPADAPADDSTPASPGAEPALANASAENTPASPSSSNPPSGQPGDLSAAAESALADLENLARSFGESNRNADAARGPLSGRGFADWADRLRTVEELVDSSEQRQRLAGARAQAEELRRTNQQQGKAPQWDLIEMGIVAPLEETRAWLRQELGRRENPDTLQPVDRDPVPERYAESVRKYYEALGTP